ncbi:sigma-70 family RNA polymerase sigma factor [Lysinibacter cavernae]|uniref:RNA polymerase sigma factor (Sigma-70 family) n=1 Tax=Lysinibacter cavernae TaxID=1640652 RepID=A0A7X5R123_9MICO|nr:RNA polymerase sigma factor (sigma-70 family) [Lysinibacter cavernae]
MRGNEEHDTFVDDIVNDDIVNDDVASDAELCDLVRRGDQTAFAELYARHHDAGIKQALHLVGKRPEAEDLLSDAFASILDVLRRGMGPTESFRGYLYMVLANLTKNQAKKTKTVPLDEDADSFLEQLHEADVNAGLGERSLVYTAFTELPERWQQVLWLLEIDGYDLNAIGDRLGIKANAVAQLASRAREGLRTAYLQLHVERTNSEECKSVSSIMAKTVRRKAGKRDADRVAAHLETCLDCRQSFEWMSDIGQQMRSIVAPLILGGSGIAGLAWGTTSASSGASAASVVAAGKVGIGAKVAIAGGAAVVAIAGLTAGLLYSPSPDPVVSTVSEEPTVVETVPVAEHPAPAPEPVVEPEPAPVDEAQPEPAYVPPSEPAAEAPVAAPPAPAAPVEVAPPAPPAPPVDEDDETESWVVITP